MGDEDRRDMPPEYCDRCPQRATYLAVKDDMDLGMCDHHTFERVGQLVAHGFHLQLIPGVRTRTPVG